LHRSHTTARRECSDAVRLVDAALGFASQRDYLRLCDAVRLLEALREELDSTPDASRASMYVQELLAHLPSADAYRSRDLVNALLDLRPVAETRSRVARSGLAPVDDPASSIS
jgi:hypothetical protein